MQEKIQSLENPPTQASDPEKSRVGWGAVAKQHWRIREFSVPDLAPQTVPGVHWNPSPWYPGWQRQEKEPGVLEQVAEGWHLFSEHSSTSAAVREGGREREEGREGRKEHDFTAHNLCHHMALVRVDQPRGLHFRRPRAWAETRWHLKGKLNSPKSRDTFSVEIKHILHREIYPGIFHLQWIPGSFYLWTNL